MAVVSRSSSTWILLLEVLLISVGAVSMALILKLSVPLFLDFAVSEVPVLWSSFRSWLKPPYLYIIINCIIITIVASSRFHQKSNERSGTLAPAKVKPDVRSDFSVTEPPEFDYKMKNPAETQTEFDVVESPAVYERSGARVTEVKAVSTNGLEMDDEDKFVISMPTWTPPQRSDSSEILTEYLFRTEKPPASARFGHRKTVKASPEGGKALRVSKPKRHETLETTWKMITDGRSMPLTRHLKKSDTWETHGHHDNADPQDPSPRMVKKSETFKDPSSSLSSSPGLGKLRKEASPSQDELNRRVEAFINKFNEDIRLQRQESLNQYMEMISRGAN